VITVERFSCERSTLMAVPFLAQENLYRQAQGGEKEIFH
jgi:hypothetical protein